jgi:hypothetical protein
MSDPIHFTFPAFYRSSRAIQPVSYEESFPLVSIQSQIDTTLMVAITHT